MVQPPEEPSIQPIGLIKYIPQNRHKVSIKDEFKVDSFLLHMHKKV